MFTALVTFDTDSINQNNRNYEHNRLCFDYDRELFELAGFLASERISATAFVRIDDQISHYHDDLFILEKVVSAIERGGSPNIELGWHPHLYAEIEGRYVLARDEGLIAEDLLAIHSRVPSISAMKCVRIGALQGGNNVMRTLDRLGFAVDSSAFPGRSVRDDHRHFDWIRCDNRAYLPSIADYQVQGDVNYRLLEVPITTIPFRAPYDRIPTVRAINPCFRSELFQKAIADNEDRLRQLGFCVLIFHPDELMHGYQDDLYRNGFENFSKNFVFFRKTMGDVKFLTVSEFGSQVKRGAVGALGQA